MVVRTRARAILLPITFYLVSGCASGFFVWQASIGDRGLSAKAEFETQMAAMSQQLQNLQAEHKTWERRVALMRSDAVDADLLDEEARAMLDRVGKNDLVIFIPPSNRR
jgi:cell division protein FtsB